MFLSTYYVPHTVLETGGTGLNKMDMVPVIMVFTVS